MVPSLAAVLGDRAPRLGAPAIASNMAAGATLPSVQATADQAAGAAFLQYARLVPQPLVSVGPAAACRRGWTYAWSAEVYARVQPPEFVAGFGSRRDGPRRCAAVRHGCRTNQSPTYRS